MENTIYTPNFKLFFGKYKGQLLSATPMSYQVWLVQTEFFKGLDIKYPHKVRKGNSDGTWYETDVLTILIAKPIKEPQVTHREIDPEERHWKNYATHLERNSY
jgi:hypothetical protein